jgi:hypothetical protein
MGQISTFINYRSLQCDHYETDCFPKSLKACSTVPLTAITSIESLSSKFNVLIKASRAVITPCLTPCPNFNYPTLFELGNIIAL